MNQAAKITERAIRGEGVSYAEAMSADAIFPASVLADIAALRSGNLSEEEERHLRRRISVAIGCRETLLRILGNEPDEFASFYPDRRSEKPTTDSAIDDFISRFAGQDADKESDALEKMIFNPVPANYAEALEVTARGEEEKENLTNRTIEEETAEQSQNAAEEPEDGALSESFAQILIKNHNYSKALEIIQTLNLNNPKKSIYFADQIRFLKKLIINANKQ